LKNIDDEDFISKLWISFMNHSLGITTNKTSGGLVVDVSAA
jgi:hypothetical protein